jgi:ABC-type glycerol-3-phosphate transport system permease component
MIEYFINCLLIAVPVVVMIALCVAIPAYFLLVISERKGKKNVR